MNTVPFASVSTSSSVTAQNKSRSFSADTCPVRVSIVSPTFGGYGGLEAFVLALLAGLPSDGQLEVRLFFKRVNGFNLQPELSSAVAPLTDRIHFVERGSLDLFRAIKQSDVVHVQNPCPDVVAISRILNRRLLINVINHRQEGRAWRQRLWDASLRRAHRRFYISEFVRSTWEGPSPWPASTVIFPICRLAEGQLPADQRKGFVFVARWVPNKGIRTLIEAYRLANLDPVAWPLRLIGDGPLRIRIQEDLRTNPLPGVELMGFLSEEQKTEMIRQSKWMVVPPQTNEDFGLTAIEARHLEVPCIVTRDGGVPEAAGDQALVCEPGDASGLSRRLKEAAAMTSTEYSNRAKRTKETLLPLLTPPEHYGHVYRQMVSHR